MKSDKLLMFIVLFAMISGCSLTEEEKLVLKRSSEGKLIYGVDENHKAEEIDPEEEPDEPPEIEITGREMSTREMSPREMPEREMSPREMPEREMSTREF
ncbi:hypothetical protein BAC3_01119 [uncultured bacterium]|nr:hypothetical protein BAC3_01119 [uncultured bacterium]